MARAILPIAGAIVGGIYGGPTGAQAGWMLGSLISGAIGPSVKKKVTIGENGAQLTTEGAPRGIVFGTASTTGNVIDAGPVRKEDVQPGKGGEPTATGTFYYRTYAIRICEGPITDLVLVKQDGAIVYDARPGADFDKDNAKFLARCTLYYGDEDQLPDPDLEAMHGAGNVPAYRGTAYIVFADDNLTSRQGSVPQYEFVVTANAETVPEVELEPVGYRTSGNAGGGFVQNESVLTHFDAAFSTGTAYLATFRMNVDNSDWPTVQGMGVDLAVDVDGETVWSATVTLDTQVSSHVVQIEHAHDHTEVTLRLACAGYSGGRALFLVHVGDTLNYPGLGPYAPVAPGVVEEGDSDFGVVEDADGQRWQATFFIDGVERWGPTIWQPPIPNTRSALLSEIVADIHDRCGADEADVSELTDEVSGLVLASADYTGADAINTLRAPYLFDRAEFDGQIHYVKRGADVVATITADDLVDEPDEAERQSPVEYPRKLHLAYQARQVNYEAAQATSDRYSPDVRVVGEAAMQVPMVLDEQGAANIAATLHKIAWADAEGEVKFALPMSWIGLVPSNCITLDLRQQRRLRIERIDDADGIRALTCRVDRRSAYTSQVTYIPLPVPEPPISRVPVDTVLELLDIPLLRDADDGVGFYAAGAPAEDGLWSGASLYRSPDGADFALVGSTTRRAVIGVATTVLPDGPWGVFDEGAGVVVDVGAGELASASRETILAGYTNMLLVGQEVIQFRDAELLAEGVYRLTGLLRGQLGTEWAIDGHGEDERVVLLDEGANRVPMEAWQLGLPYIYKGVTYGLTLADADPQEFTNTGVSLIPYAPVHLRRTGASAFSWDRRSRLSGNVFAGNMPLGEDSERYAFELLQGDTLLHSEEVTEPEIELPGIGVLTQLWTRSGTTTFAEESGGEVILVGAQLVRCVPETGAAIGDMIISGTAAGLVLAGGFIYVGTNLAANPSYVQRVDPANITPAAAADYEATYIAPAQMEIAGLAWDGTHVWVSLSATMRLDKLDATTLVAVDSYTPGGVCGRIVFADGSLYIAVDGDTIQQYDVATETLVRTIDCPGGVDDLLVTDSRLVAVGAAQITVFTLAGLKVAEIPGGVSSGNGWRRAARVGAGLVAISDVSAGEVIYLDAATGLELRRLPLADAQAVVGGSTERVYIDVGNPTPDTYVYALDADLTGITARVQQISARVGRGYTAELTL